MNGQEGKAMENKVKVEKCQSTKCGADIIFVRTKSGKRMPVEAENFDSNDCEFDHDGMPLYQHKVHTPHFIACPESEKFRKVRRKNDWDRGSGSDMLRRYE